jgi:hypothetical protein
MKKLLLVALTVFIPSLPSMMAQEDSVEKRGKAKHNCQVGSYVLRISSLRGVNQDVDAGHLRNAPRR